MRILITGGTGDVGRATVARLVGEGHDIRVLGRRETTVSGAEYAVCDVTDFPGLLEQCRDREAIVHLAAIRMPLLDESQEVFRVNCTGTYNIFEAAARCGIRRVVAASSINALGYFFGTKKVPIEYFPIDEDHPTLTTDAYSFSKQIVEEIAAYYYRREGISSICLRLPGVMNLETASQGNMFDGFDDKAPDLWRRFGRDNFWTLIDDRDAALAIALGLTVDFEGSHPLFVNDKMNFLGADSEWLIGRHFPSVMGRKHKLVGDETLVSNARAKALIGYEPQHSWRELVRSDTSPLIGFHSDLEEE